MSSRISSRSFFRGLAVVIAAVFAFFVAVVAFLSAVYVAYLASGLLIQEPAGWLHRAFVTVGILGLVGGAGGYAR